MGTYYGETWHNMPLTQRIQLAEMKYNLAKSLLEEARSRLRDYKEELTPADSYRPMQKGAPNVKLTDEFTQKMVVRD